MAVAGIEVRVAATSNMRQVTRDLAMLQRGMQGAANAQMNLQRNLGNNSYDVTQINAYESSIQRLRASTNAAVKASGLYYQTTRNLTAATADFNEKLARQKLRFSDIWGPNNVRLMRQAMREQMAMQNMIVQSYRRSGSQIDVDIFTPKHMENVRNFRKELGYFAQVGSAVAVSVTNWGKNIQWAGRQLTVGFSVPLTIALGLMGRLGYTLDEQLVRIEKVYGDGESAAQATNESIRKMATETAKHVAEQWGLAGQATLDIMGELAATGLEGPDLQAMTVETQRASLLGDLSQEESLKLLRTLREAYRQNNDELANSVNLFNEIENSTALTMNDIAEGLPRIAGIMQSTGVSMSDTLVLLTGFKEAGIDVAEGANALKSINFKAIAATPTAAKAFLQITGQDMTEIVEAAGGDFMTVMLQIADIMQGLDRVAKNNLIARVFGVHQGSRAITLLDQLAEGSTGMQRAMDAATKSSEELAATADAELAALENSMHVRFNRVKESVLLEFGEMGMLALERLLPLIEGFGRFVSWIGNLPDWIKSSGISAAIMLSIVGPLVMLTGLLGNLVGMTARSALGIIKLLAPFKILNEESKAAQLLQQAFGNGLDEATAAMVRQSGAAEGLTRQLREINDEMLKANRLQAVPAPFPQSHAATGRSMGVNAVTGGATAYSSASAYIGQSSSLAMAPLTVSELGNASATATPKVSQFNSTWMKTSATIAGAAGGVSLLASLIGNNLIANLSMGTMAVTSLLPALGTFVDGFDRRMTTLGKRTTGTFGKIGAAGAKAMSGIITAGRTAMGFMLGPYGLAIAGAVAIATFAWQKHRKEMERVQKVYDDVRNSSSALADAYGYIPGQRMEEEMRKANLWDDNSIMAQEQRIETMKDSQAELFTVLTEYGKEINSTFSEGERNAELMNEAMRQGVKVLSDTGDRALALRAAWDAYTIMGGNQVTQEQFVIQFRAEWDEDSLNSVVQAAKAVQERIDNEIGTIDFTFSGGELRDEAGWAPGATIPVEAKIDESSKNILMAEWQALLDSMTSTEIDAFQEYDLFESSFGQYSDKWHDQYKEWQDLTGNYETSFIDFMNNIDANSRRMAESGFEIMTPEDVALAKEMWPLIEKVYGSGAEVLGQYEHGAQILTGYRGAVAELVTVEEQLAVAEEYLALTESENSISRGLGNTIIEERIHLLGLQRVAESRMARLSLETAQAGIDIGTGVQEGMEDGIDAIDDGTDKIKEFQDALLEGRRTAAEWWQGEVLDDLWSQFDAEQDQTRAAEDARGEQRVKNIEAQYEREEEMLQASHEAAMDALDAREKRANEALDKDFLAEDDALKARQKLQDKDLANRQKADKKEFDSRWDRLNEEAEESQERRRKALEDSYDARVEAVNQLIEAEQEAERRRQEIYEAEKERIRRLSDMFSQNIDFNMAINSGDLDEAAKISNRMAAQTQQWALDDTSQISQTASERRIEGLRGQIDTIEEEKQARLDALKEVEKAEDEARKERQEREKEHLEELHEQQKEALDAAQEQANRALKADQKMRQEALDARFKAYQKTLDNEQQAESKSLDTRRQNAVAAQQTQNEQIRAELDVHLQDVRDNLEMQVQERIAITPRNLEEQKKQDAELRRLFGVHMDNQVVTSNTKVEKMARNYELIVSKSLREFRDDQNWGAMAADIAEQMTSGVLGVNMSGAQMREFFKTGKLPEDIGSGGGRTRDRQHEIRHAGGVIGGGGSSRVGFSGARSQSEVNLLALKGEGVLNRRAMSIPGMVNLLNEANSGRINYAPGTGDGEGMGGLAMMGVMRQIERRVAEQATLRGYERGTSLANVGGFARGTAESTGLSQEQLANAALISQIGRQLPGATERDILIALMTAMQESSLRNLNYGDRDSLGLFQQRPSQGWGTPAQITDPNYAINKFFSELLKDQDRHNKPLWQAAQDVQRSAYPMAYAQHEELARMLLGNVELPDATKIGTRQRWEDVRAGLQEAIAREDMTLFGMPPTGRLSGTGPGWEKMWRNVQSEFPHAILTSSVRSQRNTASGFRSYHNAGRAIDLASRLGGDGMMEIFNYLRSKYGALNHELYYSPAGARQILQGRPYNTKGTAAYANHFDHVHWAMKNGGTVPGVGRGDRTRVLAEPGEFMVNRRAADTYRPLLEAINSNVGMSPSLSRNIDNASSVEYNVEVNFNGPVAKEIDGQRMVEKALQNIERRRGGRRTV